MRDEVRDQGHLRAVEEEAQQEHEKRHDVDGPSCPVWHTRGIATPRMHAACRTPPSFRRLFQRSNSAPARARRGPLAREHHRQLREFQPSAVGLAPRPTSAIRACAAACRRRCDMVCPATSKTKGGRRSTDAMVGVGATNAASGARVTRVPVRLEDVPLVGVLAYEGLESRRHHACQRFPCCAPQVSIGASTCRRYAGHPRTANDMPYDNRCPGCTCERGGPVGIARMALPNGTRSHRFQRR